MESFSENIGEPEHESSGQNSDYSSTVYNGGLLFNCYSSFILNSVKVYTDYPGERLIELKDNNGNVVYESYVNVPVTDNDGYVLDLNWLVNPGDNYILTTNSTVNNANFGDNNPMLKRTTGGLPNFPFLINNILEITEGYYTQGGGNDGSSQDYYYYFYDWNVTYDRSCTSESSIINIVVTNSSIKEDFLANKLVKVIDVLGRETIKKGLNIEIYNDGNVEKKIILK